MTTHEIVSDEMPPGNAVDQDTPSQTNSDVCETLVPQRGRNVPMTSYQRNTRIKRLLQNTIRRDYNLGDPLHVG
jgi:hypothetical protein